MTQSNATPQDDVSSSAEVFAPGPAALSDEWMRYLPEEIRESFVKAQVRSRLNALNDDTPLSQDLASVYLDVSDATLKRMRASGKGPQYIQGMSEEGAKSRNQKVLYTVGALKDWIYKNRTDSTGHAAIRRGLMFQTLSDLLVPEPWWHKNGAIYGHGYSFLPISTSESDLEVCWIPMHNVLKFEFINQYERAILSERQRNLLQNQIAEILAHDEKAIIANQSKVK